MSPQKMKSRPVQQKETTKCGKSEIKCGLCKNYLCVPPTFACDSKKFICGVCYDSHLYYPDELREKMDNLIPQMLYDLYIEDHMFCCSYEKCSKQFLFGQLSLEHMKTCDKRTYACPISDTNKHYIPVHYKECDFHSGDTKELFEHIEENHQDIVVRNKINSSEFFRRPHALFVLETKGVISVIYVDKVVPNSLRISCRQMKPEVTDKCIIQVNFGRKNEKYVINCSEYIGALAVKGQKLLKYVAVDDVPIFFSIVPGDEEVEDVTSDTEEFLPPLGTENLRRQDVEDDDEFQVL